MVSPNFDQRLINRWNELVVNNPKLTPQARYQLSQITNADIKLISKYKDIQYFKKEYPDQANHPYLLEGSKLLLDLSPSLSLDIIREYQIDIGITGTRATFNYRPDDSESMAIETIIHDILSIYALTGKVPGLLGAIYGVDNIVISALFVPFLALKQSVSQSFPAKELMFINFRILLLMLVSFIMVVWVLGRHRRRSRLGFCFSLSRQKLRGEIYILSVF